MTPWEYLAIALAGLGAGFINSVAGSGSLITFPTLIALGVPPVTANVSNNVGLVPGAVSSVVGWRKELAGQRDRIVRFGLASLTGGAVGAALLLALPSAAFDAIVPVLVSLSLVLVAVQPRISAMVTQRAQLQGSQPSTGDQRWTWPAVAGAGVYGGYFGAAQGILLVAVLGLGTTDTLHRNNALKNVLAGTVNGVAAVIFIAFAEVDWKIAGVIAVGSVIGAQIGAHAGRRMSAGLLRGVILVVGATALVVFLVR